MIQASDKELTGRGRECQADRHTGKLSQTVMCSVHDAAALQSVSVAASTTSTDSSSSSSSPERINALSVFHQLTFLLLPPPVH